MTFLLDQNVPADTLGYVENEFECVHVRDLGMSRASDATILAYAQTHPMVVVTFDADFHSILTLSGDTAPSVIRLREDGLKGRDVADLLRRLAADHGKAIQGGVAMSVTERRVSLRRLPLRA